MVGVHQVDWDTFDKSLNSVFRIRGDMFPLLLLLLQGMGSSAELGQTDSWDKLSWTFLPKPIDVDCSGVKKREEILQGYMSPSKLFTTDYESRERLVT